MKDLITSKHASVHAINVRTLSPYDSTCAKHSWQVVHVHAGTRTYIIQVRGWNNVCRDKTCNSVKVETNAYSLILHNPFRQNVIQFCIKSTFFNNI